MTTNSQQGPLKSTFAHRARSNALADWICTHRLAIAALCVFTATIVFYGNLLYPGLGGELNSGDSAKFQVLGHRSIMVHGPGYPLVLMLGAVVRFLPLPVPDWWAMTFALSAIPGSIAVTLAFLVIERLTRSILFGIAGATWLAGASLMAVQATEAEVYALTLAFILGTSFLLILFVQTGRLGFFLAACALYSLSFGNHLMMIMLVPMFLTVTAIHHRIVLCWRIVAIVLGFILVGASQYLYLAYIAYSPNTAYSEYLPLPPEPMELIHYILGTYFSDLYGSGMQSTLTLEALLTTFRSAYPGLSLPVVVAGVMLFAAGWRRRDIAWRGLAVIYGTGISFVPFALWYGAYDIQAFHLPVLGPFMVASMATFGWWLRDRKVMFGALTTMVLVLGVMRAGQTAMLLSGRAPAFAGIRPAVESMIDQSPVDTPIVAMSYGVRMATLYYELRGELPTTPIYRVHWRAIALVEDQPSVGGIVVPAEGYQFVQWIEEKRPDMTCQTQELRQPDITVWPAYSFECHSGTEQSAAARDSSD